MVPDESTESVGIDLAGDRLKLLVDQSGLTQEEFGQQVGFSKSYVNRICTGANKPSLKFAESLAAHRGVSPNWFLFGLGPQLLDAAPPGLLVQDRASSRYGSPSDRDLLEAIRDDVLWIRSELGGGLSAGELTVLQASDPFDALMKAARAAYAAGGDEAIKSIEAYANGVVDTIRRRDRAGAD